jgi:hypothetical protein
MGVNRRSCPGPIRVVRAEVGAILAIVAAASPLERRKRGQVTYPSPPGVNYKIPIGAAIGLAYRTVFGNFGLLVAFGWLPFVIMVAIKLVVLAAPPLIMAEGIVDSLLWIVFGAIFMVRWHRFILLGETESNALFPPGWGPFLLVSIKVMLVISAVIVLTVVPTGLVRGSLLTVLLTPLLITALLLTVLLIIIGVSLAFPAAAIERPISFRAAWNLLAGNYWRLLICVIACYLPFAVAEEIAAAIDAGLLSILVPAVALAITFVGVAVEVALISDTYRCITGEGRGGISSAFD